MPRITLATVYHEMQKRFDAVETKADIRFEFLKEKILEVDAKVETLDTKVNVLDAKVNVLRTDLTVVRNQTAHVPERVAALEPPRPRP